VSVVPSLYSQTGQALQVFRKLHKRRLKLIEALKI